MTPWAPSASAFQWFHYTVSQEKIKLHKYITYDPGNGSFAELLSCVFHSWCIVLFITVCQCDSSIILLFTVLPFSSAVKMKRKSMPLKRIMTNSPPARSVLIYLVFFFFFSFFWILLISECACMEVMEIWRTILGNHYHKGEKYHGKPLHLQKVGNHLVFCTLQKSVARLEMSGTKVKKRQIKWHWRHRELVQFCTSETTCKPQWHHCVLQSIRVSHCEASDQRAVRNPQRKSSIRQKAMVSCNFLSQSST